MSMYACAAAMVQQRGTNIHISALALAVEATSEMEAKGIAFGLAVKEMGPGWSVSSLVVAPIKLKREG